MRCDATTASDEDEIASGDDEMYI